MYSLFDCTSCDFIWFSNCCIISYNCKGVFAFPDAILARWFVLSIARVIPACLLDRASCDIRFGLHVRSVLGVTGVSLARVSMLPEVSSSLSLSLSGVSKLSLLGMFASSPGDSILRRLVVFSGVGGVLVSLVLLYVYGVEVVWVLLVLFVFVSLSLAVTRSLPSVLLSIFTRLVVGSLRSDDMSLVLFISVTIVSGKKFLTALHVRARKVVLIFEACMMVDSHASGGLSIASVCNWNGCVFCVSVWIVRSSSVV